jgi:hypothetical protein
MKKERRAQRWWWSMEAVNFEYEPQVRFGWQPFSESGCNGEKFQEETRNALLQRPFFFVHLHTLAILSA